MINPIEIDEDYVIVTGEMRWRGAILAGLKTVPVKVISVKSKNDRFIRQVHENLSHNTMSTMDTAEALRKSSEILFPGTKKAYMKLSNIFGMRYATVVEYFQILDEPKEIRDLLAKQTIPRTIIRVLAYLPERYKDVLKKKILKERTGRDAAAFIVKKIRDLDKVNNKKLIKKILDVNYENLITADVIQKVSQLSSGMEIMGDDASRRKAIDAKIQELSNLLEDNPLASFSLLTRPSVATSINLFLVEVSKYCGMQVIDEKENVLLKAKD